MLPASSRNLLGMGLQLREATAAEWLNYRALRLEMLNESPRAYGDDLRTASARPDRWWQVATRSQMLPDAGWFVAADETCWRGQMLTRIYDDRVYLLEVYLSPALRGSGAAQELLGMAERWTVAQGYGRLWLDVNERQTAARRFYEREGFVVTGAQRAHALYPEDYELEMVKELRSS